MNDKRCCSCKQIRPFIDFNKNKSRKSGLHDNCRECCHEEYLLNKEKYKFLNRVRYYRNPESWKKYNKEWCRKNPELVRKYNEEWKERYPEKYKAHQAVSIALKQGKLVKQGCRDCGDKNADAHHFDYSKPLEVIWLCSQHHCDEHSRLGSRGFGEVLK